MTVTCLYHTPETHVPISALDGSPIPGTWYRCSLCHESLFDIGVCKGCGHDPHASSCGAWVQGGPQDFDTCACPMGGMPDA